MNIKHITGLTALLAAAAGGTPAFAAACGGANVGTSATGDVSFQSAASDDCWVASGNAQAGPNGNPGVFSGAAFGSGTWTLLAKVDGSGAVTNSNTIPGVTFTTSFSKDSGNKSGTWGLTAAPGATLDLVFAMHAGGYTGSFFFDNESVGASGTGTWAINWVNNGGNNPDYSNLTLFARDVTPVPEPAAYGLALAGLLLAGFAARRRKA